MLEDNPVTERRLHAEAPLQNVAAVRAHLPTPRSHRGAAMLLTPVPMGERRSSGMSALHSTYRDESHLLVDVTVTEVKDGCALGLVLEQLDEAGEMIAAEMVSTYVAPRTHQFVAEVKGSRLRIKWLQVGLKPSSTFGVVIQGVSSVPSPVEFRQADPSGMKELLGIDLTTLHGLREYLGVMRQEAGTG